MKTTYWTTKTGQNIDIDEMSIEHLRNTLKMIVNTKSKRIYGDIAVESIHKEFESNLGYRFNDDESRGNQW